MPRKEQINLHRGWPAPELLPAAPLRRAANKMLSDPVVSVPSLQYGLDGGYEPLREELAQWLGRFYNTSPDPDRICITGGASQSVACILQSYTDPIYTRAVWMVAPCYFLACPIFADSGFEAKMRAVPEDPEGIDLVYLENAIQTLDRKTKGPGPEPIKHPKTRKIYKHVIYVVPTCANPSGKSMSLSRREGLVHLARRYDALVICDDVYDFLQWPASGQQWQPPVPERPAEMRLPRLIDIDRALKRAPGDIEGFGHVASNGSFSKLVGPGVRTGWVEAKDAFSYGLSQTGSSISGGAPSQMNASILYELLKSGELDTHIEGIIRPTLQRRHRLMSDAINRYLSPYGISAPTASLPGGSIYGGYFMWLTLPASIMASEVARRAKNDENLIIGQGSLFEVHGDEESLRFWNDIRLSFSWEPEDAIVEGVRRLGTVLGSMRY